MPNPSKDQNKYPYVTLAFDDWKYSSAHKKGSSNPITMKNHFQVMFFRQKKTYDTIKFEKHTIL